MNKVIRSDGRIPIKKGLWCPLRKMYFPKIFEPKGYIYYHPTVLVEHENNRDLSSKQGDFWKVCLFTSPLRVFIGYCSGKAIAIDHANKLCEYYLKYRMK